MGWLGISLAVYVSLELSVFLLMSVYVTQYSGKFLGGLTGLLCMQDAFFVDYSFKTPDVHTNLRAFHTV